MGMTDVGLFHTETMTQSRWRKEWWRRREWGRWGQRSWEWLIRLRLAKYLVNVYKMLLCAFPWPGGLAFIQNEHVLGAEHRRGARRAAEALMDLCPCSEASWGSQICESPVDTGPRATWVLQCP